MLNFRIIGFYLVTLLLPFHAFAQTRILPTTRKSALILLPFSEGADSATTRVSITNSADEPIQITQIEVAPVGISAHLDTMEMASHASTILTITAEASKFANLAGETRAAIALIADKTHVPIYVTIKLVFPDVITASSHTLFWSFGESDAAKTVDINMAKDVEGKIVQIKIENDGNSLISYQQARNDDGSYTLSIRPPTTEVGFGGVLIFSVTADVLVNNKHVLKTQKIQIEVGARGKLPTRPSTR
jgi:hypothetical protein